MEGQTVSMQDVADLDPFRAAGFDPSLAGVRAGHAARGTRFGSVWFEQAVKADVFSRLAARHVRPPAAEPTEAAAVRDLVAFLLCQHERGSLDGHVEAALSRGLPLEHVFLRLFQPAARRLGELWANDIASFVDITLAVSRLQRALRDLAPRFQRHGRPPDGTRSIVLATLPGDQHTFGAVMAAEFFRRGGWIVRSGTADEVEDLVARMPTHVGTVVGLSASRADQTGELAAFVRHVRAACGTRVAGVLVGGPLLVTHPDRARAVGADGVASDAGGSLAQAEALVTGAGSG